MITQTLARSLAYYASRTILHPLASDAGILAVSQYVAAGLGFITNIVAAWLLGPADYGIATLVMAYPTLLWSFMSVKSISVTTRYISGFRACGQCEQLKSMTKLGYGLDLAAALIGFVLVCLTAWGVSRYVYHIPELTWVMIAYAGSFPLYSPIGTSQAILSSWQRFRWLAMFQFLDPCITLLLVVSALLAGFGVPGMVIATALGQATIGITVLIAATYMLYREGLGFWWYGPLDQIATLRKELISLFGWNYLMTTFSGVAGQMPVLLLGHLRGGEEAGFYRLATSLMTVGSYPESSLRQITYPILSARWSMGERQSLKKLLWRWTLWGGLPISLLVALTIPIVPFAVPRVFGVAYMPMVFGVQVMLGGATVSAILFWLVSFYYASGRIDVWAKGYGLYTFFVIIFGWFFIQLWGFDGLAVIVTLGKVLFILGMVALFACRLS